MTEISDRQRIDWGTAPPVKGELIKVKFSGAIMVPGSNLSSSAVTGAAEGNYHAAVVRGVVNDRINPRLILDDAGLTSTNTFQALPEMIRLWFLPLPSDTSLRQTPVTNGKRLLKVLVPLWK